MAQNPNVSSSDILRLIKEFQDETKAEILWQLTESHFATPGGATAALARFIAERLDTKG